MTPTPAPQTQRRFPKQLVHKGGFTFMDSADGTTVFGEGFTQDGAAEIVRRFNSHDELIAVCKEAADELECNCPGPNCQRTCLWSKARAILTRLTGATHAK